MPTEPPTKSATDAADGPRTDSARLTARIEPPTADVGRLMRLN